MQGVVYKQHNGRFVKSFKKRWLVLEESSNWLKYFASQQDGEAWGQIEVKTILLAQCSKDENLNKKNICGFEVISSERTHVFYAYTIEERASWIAAIMKALKQLTNKPKEHDQQAGSFTLKAESPQNLKSAPIPIQAGDEHSGPPRGVRSSQETDQLQDSFKQEEELKQRVRELEALYDSQRARMDEMVQEREHGGTHGHVTRNNRSRLKGILNDMINFSMWYELQYKKELEEQLEITEEENEKLVEMLEEETRKVVALENEKQQLAARVEDMLEEREILLDKLAQEREKSKT